MEEMEIYGNGKFWKLTYIHRGGVKCAKQNFPRYIICGRKNFEKIKKNFFDFENFELKKGKNIKLINGILLFIIFSIFCVYLCSCIIEALIGKK